MGDELDPKGLIADAYRIEGIGLPECRSIFLDWALSLPVDADTVPAITALLARQDDDSHPMTQVLREGLAETPRATRRGGRAARMPEA